MQIAVGNTSESVTNFTFGKTQIDGLDGVYGRMSIVSENLNVVNIDIGSIVINETGNIDCISSTSNIDNPTEYRNEHYVRRLVVGREDCSSFLNNLVDVYSLAYPAHDFLQRV